MNLNNTELRILGALVEKDFTTPDYYPMSLNALKNACNQKSNREPVMNLDEEEILSALKALNEKKMVIFSSGQQQRVIKYKHALLQALAIDRRETALMAVLILRGKQTAGELRQHTQRMHLFDSVPQVIEILNCLCSREEPLVKLLPRQPGQKEQRYCHLLGEVLPETENTSEYKEISASSADLQSQIDELKTQLNQLRQEFNDLKNLLI